MSESKCRKDLRGRTSSGEYVGLFVERLGQETRVGVMRKRRNKAGLGGFTALRTNEQNSIVVVVVVILVVTSVKESLAEAIIAEPMLNPSREQILSLLAGGSLRSNLRCLLRALGVLRHGNIGLIGLAGEDGRECC